MSQLDKWERVERAVDKDRLGLSATGYVRLWTAVREHVNYLYEVTPDVKVQDEGSIVVLYLQTPNAREWVHEHVDTEGAQWWAGNGLVVEHRFAEDIISGMQDGGLTVA